MDALERRQAIGRPRLEMRLRLGELGFGLAALRGALLGVLD